MIKKIQCVFNQQVIKVEIYQFCKRKKDVSFNLPKTMSDCCENRQNRFFLSTEGIVACSVLCSLDPRENGIMGF